MCVYVCISTVHVTHCPHAGVILAFATRPLSHEEKPKKKTSTTPSKSDSPTSKKEEDLDTARHPKKHDEDLDTSVEPTTAEAQVTLVKHVDLDDRAVGHLPAHVASAILHDDHHLDDDHHLELGKHDSALLPSKHV